MVDEAIVLCDIGAFGVGRRQVPYRMLGRPSAPTPPGLYLGLGVTAADKVLDDLRGFLVK